MYESKGDMHVAISTRKINKRKDETTTSDEEIKPRCE
jgi:hypothetical protein